MLSALRNTTLRSTRAFTTSARASDISKATIVGRLASEPQQFASKNGQNYLTYTVATAPGARRTNDAGESVAPPTSYHKIYVFRPESFSYIERLPKGSTLYVEADLSTRRIEPTTEDGKATYQTNLVHRQISVIAKPKSHYENEGAETESE